MEEDGRAEEENAAEGGKGHHFKRWEGINHSEGINPPLRWRGGSSRVNLMLTPMLFFFCPYQDMRKTWRR